MRDRISVRLSGCAKLYAGVMAISSLWFFFLDFFVCLSEIAIRPDMGIFLLITIKPKVHSRHLLYKYILTKGHRGGVVFSCSMFGGGFLVLFLFVE